MSELKKALVGKMKFTFVYGSILTKYFNKESDIDLAAYFGKTIDYEKMYNFKEKISEHFDYKYEFDIIALDTADPIIAMQVLANGKLIHNNDYEAHIKYKSRLISEYIDFKMDRKIIEDKIAERLHLCLRKT